MSGGLYTGDALPERPLAALPLKWPVIPPFQRFELQPPPPKSPFSKLTLGKPGAGEPRPTRPDNVGGAVGAPTGGAVGVPATQMGAAQPKPAMPRPGHPPPLPGSPKGPPPPAVAIGGKPVPATNAAAQPVPVVGGLAPPEPAASANPGPAAKIVLVVEDDGAIRDMLVRALGTIYRVYEASDGQMALDVLGRIKVPDLIIMDVMMPRMDGLALAAKIKTEQRFKPVPLIFLTGRDSPKDVVQGINVGARHYLTKPFKIQDLLDKAAKAVGLKKS